MPESELNGLPPVRKLQVRVAYLTHVISPHRLALIECFAAEVLDFRVFLSEAQDVLHKFPIGWGTLNVTLQHSINWTHRFRNVHGYLDISHINVPYDTLVQLKRHRPKLIISTELGTRSLLAAVYRARRKDVKMILWATLSDHTEATRGWIRNAVRRWVLGKVDAVFVNGKAGAEYLKRMCYTGTYYFIPYAIDQAPFLTTRYDPSPGTMRLLYTGQLIPRKGLPSFCRLLSEWCQQHPQQEVVMVFVGEGPEESLLRAIHLSPNLKVVINGSVTQSRLVQFHEESDVYVLPTLGDEWGVVVNESLIAGRPVLGSIYSQAALELIEEGENGWLWNPRAPENTRAVLDRVMSTSVERLRQMSARARDSIAEVAPNVIASRMLRAVSEVLASSPQRTRDGQP